MRVAMVMSIWNLAIYQDKIWRISEKYLETTTSQINYILEKKIKRYKGLLN